MKVGIAAVLVQVLGCLALLGSALQVANRGFQLGSIRASVSASGSRFKWQTATTSLRARHSHLTLRMSPNNNNNDDDNDVNSDRAVRPFAWKKTLASLTLAAAAVFGTPGSSSFQLLPAYAADTAKVGLCLLKSCQKELAQCVLNPKCLANVVCLNTCNDRKDEAACQIQCGNYFENEVVGKFNACAVSQKKCVPQKPNNGEYPLPSAESMVKKFDTSLWNGRWYISAGLNKLFDIFPCQVHFFTSPAPDRFYAKINWRIEEPDGEEFTKNTVQNFKQDPKNPAHFINHDNEYLNYKDDWYIVDYEPDDFILVYYQGSNDAWDGYGGAFLYTRAPSVRPDLFPRLERAMEATQLKYKWSDFTLTDNSCPVQTKSPTLLREEYVGKLLLTEEVQLQQQLTALRNAAVTTVVEDEKELADSIVYFEKEIAKFEKEVVREVIGVEKAVERAVTGGRK